MSEETARRCASKVLPARQWTPRPCGKMAKGTLADGQPACGIHLAVERRDLARRAQSARDEAQRNDDRSAAQSRVHDIGCIEPPLLPSIVERRVVGTNHWRYQPHRIEVDYDALMNILNRNRRDDE